jgi:phage shock protein PspC (stress-responsive transcriptional regulator)
MTRSFVDRVFGGVCGGLAGSLPVNAWTLRIVFIILTPLSLGLAGLVYVGLWWLMPQESLISDVRISTLRALLIIGMLVASVALWIGNLSGSLITAEGVHLYGYLVALLFSVIFLIRQVRI